jgi:hypothetical protein
VVNNLRSSLCLFLEEIHVGRCAGIEEDDTLPLSALLSVREADADGLFSAFFIVRAVEKH